jgi:ADP-ribose pyrophosphatase
MDQLNDSPDISERILSSTRVYNGSFLKLDEVQVELPNGHRTVHDVLRHPGAVAIIALSDRGDILLEHQYRTSLERVVLEIPAGKLEPGEDVLDCARRELAEETGFTARELRYLTAIATAAGYSDEIIHLCIATGLEPGEPSPDSDEFLTTCWMPLDDLVNEVLDARIEDSKTVIAALLCDALRHRLE